MTLKMVVVMIMAFLFSAGSSMAQVAGSKTPDNVLLGKQAIVEKRALITTDGVNESLRQKAEFCRLQPDAEGKKACEVGYEWLHATGKFLAAQLDMMEVVGEMKNPGLKSWLIQTMSEERFNAELAMAHYRAVIITSRFAPRSRASALEKKP